MHEMSIVQGILQACLPEAEKQGAKKITSVKLKIGEMSGLVPQIVEEYFHIAAQGTAAAEAKLVIERTPVRIHCRDCGYEGGIVPRKYRCPECESADFQITSGREYLVESMEVDD